MSNASQASSRLSQAFGGGNVDIVKVLLEGRAFFALILIIIVFSILSPNYFSLSNFLTMANHVAIYGLLSIGMLLVILNGGIDLSVGSALALAGVIAGALMQGVTLSMFGVVLYPPVWAVVVLTCVLGGCIGAVNGVLIAYLRVPAFVATLGTLYVARGVALLMTNGLTYNNLSGRPELGNTGFDWLGFNRLAGVPIGVLVLAVVAVVCHLMLTRTAFGRWLYASGGNERAADLSGVPVKRVKITVYVLSGICAAIAGLVLSSQLTSAGPTAGTTYELTAIAAVVIGGAALTGGRGTVGGTMLGAFVIGFLSDGLVIVGVSAYWQTVFTGAVIVLAVLLNSIQYGRGAGSHKHRRLDLSATATGRAAVAESNAAWSAITQGKGRHCKCSRLSKRALLAAVAITPLLAGSAWAEGLISIIVTDPSNPYWLTEGKVAEATAKEMGYTATVAAHKGDTNTESNLIDTAITNKSVAIILDPANADGSVGAVKKAVAANIPVFLVNAEINQDGLAKAQLVSNNAQGAAIGAQQWVESVGDKGKYVELFGNPADNNAATRSNGYETVLTQYPDLEKSAQEVANWDRTQGFNKMQSMLQANPDIVGVISGNDEMALGAIAALKEAGKLDQIKVGGFDGSPDAVAAVKAGEMQYTVLQPVATFSAEAVRQADSFIKTGKTGADSEKQLFDCILVTKDNVDDFTGPFTMKQ